METITIRSDYHFQNRLKAEKRQLDYCRKINVSKFRFNRFECIFNNPYDASITFLKSDIENLKTFFEASKGDLHQLRGKIVRGQTYDPDTYLYLLRWNKIADKTLKLIKQKRYLSSFPGPIYIKGSSQCGG